MKRLIVIWSIIAALPVSSVLGQDRVNEQEVNIQKIFIDANRERILGNYEKAEGLYNEVLKLDKSNHAAAYELGRIYDVLGQEDKAVKSIKTAIALDPENEWYRQFLADVFQKTGQDSEAAAVYEELVKKKPENDYFYYKWAYFLVKANAIDKALKVYDDLEKRIGINEEIIRRKHTLYLGTGNNKKAAKELERLIAAFPGNTEYRYLLANFYEQTGQGGEAHKVYQEILKINPGDVKATLAIAGAGAPANDDIAYLQSLQPVFRQADVDIDLKITRLIPLISKVADTNDKDLAAAAIELTDILEEVHPGEAKAYSASGDLLYHSGQRAAARQKYEKTLELDNTVFLVWEQLLHIYLEEENFSKLDEVSENAMDLFPNKAVLYYFNGVAEYKLARNKEALDMLDQALLMAGNDGKLLFDIQAQLGLVYHALQRHDQSENAFEAALKLNPKAPEVLNNYSFTLAMRGEQLEKAKTMSALANEMIPNQPQYQDTFGWILYKMKEFSKARKWIGDALNNGGQDDPGILEHYGDVLFHLSETDQALEYWTKAREKGSKSKLLEKKISDRQLYE